MSLSGDLTIGHAGDHVAKNGASANSAEPPALNVVIVGAGVGGLTTALFLRQQGHKVIVLEQSRAPKETGAAMHLAPNSVGLLKRLGITLDAVNGNLMESITEYDANNTIIRDVDLKERNLIWQHEWGLVHRVHLHEELKRRAQALEGQGQPVELRVSSRVVEVDTELAIVLLENGETVRGDVVVGADGVHSVTRHHVPGGHVSPKPSGKRAFRFLVPRVTAQDDPVTRVYAQRDGQLIIWYGDDRRIVMYPCNSNKYLNFVCIHPAAESRVTSDYVRAAWDGAVTKAKMIQVYTGFPPAVLALLDKANAESLKAWELLDMDVIPTWINGRLALLGDAAHPFLPHQGQGGACAMEDAASLAVMLPRGLKASEIPERLRLYEQCRITRANTLQQYSRIAGQDGGHKNFDMMEYTNFNLGHDEWDYSTNQLRKWSWAQNPNLYWRMPVAFGPMPGPRQTFTGGARSATASTFATASIKFKTSRTVLQNLFPSTSFRFRSPGTVAYASFSQTTLNKMEWLGGSGYRHLGLYIHGVQYVQKNGDVIDGTYLPVLFENLADPIVSGREELGMPKLYTSIDIWRRERSFRIQQGWQGATFGSFHLDDLEEVDPGTDKGTIGGEDDQGILAYKYIPRVGERGKADVEHATFVPHAEESKVVPSTVRKVYKAKKATVRLDPLDWESLPTLHHVVARLAEIPIYEVVQAKVVEGTGVPDVSSARRID